MLWLLFFLLTPPPVQSAPDPGERAFQRCAACHTLGADDGQSAPSLGGVMGRRAGAVKGFAYSDGMRAAGARGLVWDEATLERYLADPEAVVPGTSMPYQGGRADERAAVVDWLRRRR